MKAMNVVRLSFTGLICAGLLTACYDPNGLKAKRSYPKAEWDKYFAEKAKAKGDQKQNQKQTEMQPDADDLAKMKQAQDSGVQQQDGAQSKTTTETDASENAWVKETEGLLQSKIADADKVVTGVTITFDGKTGSLGLDALVAIDAKTNLMVNGASATPLKFDTSEDKLVQTIPVQVLDVDGNPVADEMAKNVSVKAACIVQGCEQVLVRMRVNSATAGLIDTVYLITSNKQNIYQIAESNLPTMKDFETAQNDLGQDKAKANAQKAGSLKVVDGDKADGDKEDNIAPKATSTHNAPYSGKAKTDASKADAAASETSVDKSADGKVVSTPHGDRAQLPTESAQAKGASQAANLKAQIAQTPMTEVKTVAPTQLQTNKASAKTLKEVAPEADYQDSKPLKPLKLLDLGQKKAQTAPAAAAGNSYQDSKAFQPLKLLDLKQGKAAVAQKNAGNSYQDSKPLQPLKLLDLGQSKAQSAAAPSGNNTYQDSKPLQPLKLLDLGQKTQAAAPAQQKQAVDQKGMQNAQEILAANVGTRQIMQKDGSTKLIKPDGTVIIINADGTIRSTTAAQTQADPKKADLLK